MTGFSTHHFNEIPSNGWCTDSWYDAIVVLIQKRGSRDITDSYMGCLILQKRYTSVVTISLYDWTYESKKTAEISKGHWHSVIHHVFTLHVAIKK